MIRARYQKPESAITKQRFLELEQSKDIEQVCEAIIASAYHISDVQWLIQRYQLLLELDSAEVRGATVSALGHLARLRSGVSSEQLLSILRPLEMDKDIGGRVEDAIEDVQRFCDKL